MSKQTDIFTELCQDEAVCFIAGRYHVSSQEVIHCFLIQDGIIPASEDVCVNFCLEDNEVEILRGLMTKSHL